MSKKQPVSLWRDYFTLAEETDSEEISAKYINLASKNARECGEYSEYAAMLTEGLTYTELIDLQIALLEMLKERYSNGS